MKIGYICKSCNGKDVTTQIKKFDKEKIDKVVIEESLEFLTRLPYQSLLKEIRAGDTLVFYNFQYLNIRLLQFKKLLEDLESRNIYYNFLEPEIQDLKSVKKLIRIDEDIMRRKTREGLEKAREQGRIGGRPCLDDNKIAQIKFLYFKKKYSLREIAARLDVSLGAVYKYVNLDD